MLEQIFVEFPGRIFHAPRIDSRGSDCPICASLSSGERVLGRVGDLHVMAAEYPYVPGHVLLAPDRHLSDPARVPPSVGEPIFEGLRLVSERLGNKFWIFANVGWVAGQALDHVVFHVVPDPWDIPTDFTEDVDLLPSFDPFTDIFTDGLRFKKFLVRYPGAHMSGVIVDGFSAFRRAVSKMRAKFGHMRRVLCHQRAAVLERGRVPHLGYTLLVLNYSGPQFVVIPRVFLPKSGRWGALEILYRAELSRDLMGSAREDFMSRHMRLAGDLAPRITGG